MPDARRRPPLRVVFVWCLCCVGLAASGCNGSDQVEGGWSFDDDLPSETSASSNCGGVLPERTVISDEPVGAGRQSLELGPTGCPHVTFVEESSDEAERVKYAYWDGEAWQIEVVDEVAPHSSANALAIDDQLRASVAYAMDEGERLMFARRDEAGSWRSERVADLHVRTLDHTVDPDGRPVIAAKASPDGRRGDQSLLAYFYRDSTGWHREDVIAGAPHVAGSPEVVFDSRGRPHLAAMVDGGRAIYSYRTGDGSWRREQVQFERPFPSIVQWALDANDQPHLLSCGIEAGTHHVYRHDTGWRRERIRDVGESGYYCGGLALDAQNRLHALYGPRTAGRARQPMFHATFDGDGWTEEVLGEATGGEFRVDSRRGVIHVFGFAERPPSEGEDAWRHYEVVYRRFPLAAE